MKHQLSKSTFMRGIKCEKSLYLNKHHNNLRDETSDRQEAIFEQGTYVGELAKEVFGLGPDYTPESHFDFGPSIQATKEAIQRGEKVIYEGAFLYNEVLVAIDVLVKTKDGYDAIEVKSSTELKEVYKQDVSLQAYVIQNCGVNLTDVSVMYINNQYVRQGALNVHDLFTIDSIWSLLDQYQAAIPNYITRFKSVLNGGSIPVKPIGPHCSKPYGCDFAGECWKNVPEYSVFNISRIGDKAFDLYHAGIVEVTDIPASMTFSDNQTFEIQSAKTQNSIIDKHNLNAFTDGLIYPIYHLDFETMGHAVPQFDDTRPYQQYVFQYSVHKQDAPMAEPEHFEFLADPASDPRYQLIDRLTKDCGDTGDVLVYNIGFEKGKLNDLAELFPDKAFKINSIIDRLKDLMKPFQQKHYYLPEMRGRYSIKNVLPAVVPAFETAYKELAIDNGGAASSTFAKMADGRFKGGSEQTRKDLLAYCKLDTLAMVEILNKIYQL